jgi:4a-hydroxytetrahydrobiopterin dehydratase
MPISTEDIRRRLAGMSGWTFEHEAIVRSLEFPTFPDAVAFVTRLAFDAQAADHHPDLTVSYKRVKVVWSTHSEHGVTEKDFDGAKRTDAIAHALGAREPK